MTEPALAQLQDAVGRARRAQAAVDDLGAGPGALAAPRRLLRPLEVRDIGMRAAVTLEVAVVRAGRPLRCARCGHRRVVYALTITGPDAFGSPEYEWRCSTCWGLR